MPFLLVRNDITKMQVDAVVNPANTDLLEGRGTSRAIYLAAGEEKLKAACARIGHCDPGKAVATKGFDLPAGYIIHAVGPVWKGGCCGEETLLYDTYREALELARKCGAESIAFPLLSSGSYGYPKDQALRVAAASIRDFLQDNDMLVYLVLYDRDSVLVSRELVRSIESYIDDHYVEAKREQYWLYPDARPGMPGQERRESGNMPPAAQESSVPFRASPVPGTTRERESVPQESSVPFGASPVPGTTQEGESVPQDRPAGFAVSPAPELQQEGENAPRWSQKERSRKLEALIRQMGETFSQMLLRLIDEKGYTDAQVYHRANIDRRHFSKIRTNMNYIPNKKTVIALAVALELSLDEAKDLLRSAGFSFSDSSRFDVIVRFFLENRIYDVFEINEVLFAYDQPLIGS